MVERHLALAPLPAPCGGGRTWTVSVYPPLREDGPWWAFAVEVAHDQADDVLAVAQGASGEADTGYAAALDALASAMPEPRP